MKKYTIPTIESSKKYCFLFENTSENNYSKLNNTIAQNLIKEIWGVLDVKQKALNLIKLYQAIDTENKDITSKIISGIEIPLNINTLEQIIDISFEAFFKNEIWIYFTNKNTSYEKLMKWIYFSFDNYLFGNYQTKQYYQKIILNNKKFFLKLFKKISKIL